MDILVRQEALMDALAKANTIAVSGHVKPDGDCIGATMGLSKALVEMGKSVRVLFPPYRPSYDIIPGKELIASKEDVENLDLDLFIALDCAEENRLGEYLTIFKKAKQTINIDHHVSNTYYADINCVFSDASSASEIVFHLISSDFMMSKEIASALYAGIMYDTGGLRYPNTSTGTLQVVSRLLELGIDFPAIAEKILYSHSIAKSKLLARAIDKMHLTPCQKVVYSSIEKKDFEETGSSTMETEGIVGYLLGTEGVAMSVFFYEDGDNGIKISFRSKGELNVCRIAQIFGGGGHLNASACIVKDSLENVMAMVLDEIYNIMVGSK